MATYVTRPKPASKADYANWQRLGYTGSYDHYCRSKLATKDGVIFIKGDLGPHCSGCADVSSFLCDFPVAGGKTCDAPMCDDHAHAIGHEIHYCEAHYEVWREFRDRGGVDAVLRNVIAFPNEK